MRALAAFIMRGRLQAAAVTLLGNWIPLIGSGALALVTLRRGSLEGTLILGIALLLPAASAFYLSQEEDPVVWLARYYALCVPIVVYAAALALRATVSWPLSLVAVSLASAGVGLALLLFFRDDTQAVADWLKAQAPNAVATNTGAQGGDEAQPVSATLLSGLIAFFIAIYCLLTLTLGRWWQALLYNPGGFRQEFHQLRLSPALASLCFGAAAICIVQPGLMFWSLVAALPLIITSLSIAHQFAAAQGLGKFWLVVFYLALATFLPFTVGMVLLSFADSWMDLRKKLVGKSNSDKR